MLLGCIADDLTGATDLAVNLAREDLSVVQVNGVPHNGIEVPDADAVVVALKSRTIPAAEAIAQSMTALAWLREHGTRRIYFKYCSTFDSTPLGNIGPVTENWPMRSAPSSRRPRLLIRGISAPSIVGTCSSETSCCRRRVCATIRSRR